MCGSEPAQPKCAHETRDPADGAVQANAVQAKALEERRSNHGIVGVLH